MRPCLKSLASCSILLLPLGCGGGSSSSAPAELGALVLDINEETSWPVSSVSRGAGLGPQYIFSAGRDDVGRELFITDGTTAQTRLLMDILPGELSSDPDNFTTAGGLLYFTAADEAGDELWVTDGTTAGTRRVADLLVGCADSNPRDLVPFGDRVLLVAQTETDIEELWIADASGATRLTSFGEEDAYPGKPVMLGSQAFFSAYTPTYGREIYVTDGTPGGTALFFETVSGTGSGLSAAAGMIEMGGSLYFRASDSTWGSELWATDGTVAGTGRVADINPGGASSSPSHFAVLGSRLFFRATQAGETEPWVSDGTAAGTTMLANLYPGGSSAPEFMETLNGRLFFRARTAAEGTELWATDGTPGGTVLIKDTNPGSANGYPRSLTRVGDRLFFTTTSELDGTELWSTDGTTAGTSLYRDFRTETTSSGPASSSPSALQEHNGKLYFAASTEQGHHLHVAQGTQVTPLPIDSPTGGDGATITPVVLNGIAYFRGNDGLSKHGQELWQTDGTPAGTRLVADILAGPGSSNPRAMFAYRDQILFIADDGIHGTELWRTDGTAAGTTLVADLNTGFGTSGVPNSSSPSSFVAFKDRVYFTATTQGLGRELWVTNGTTAGTVLIADLNAGTGSSYPRELTVLGDQIFFAATKNTGEIELFATDGTASRTGVFFDFRGTGSGSVRVLGATSQHVLVQANGGDGREPWVTDGTVAGTVQLGDLNPGTGSSYPTLLGALDNRFLFSIEISYRLSAIYVSDGTPAGTTSLREFDNYVQTGAVIGGQVYFSATSEDSGFELWRTDGTAAGTERMTEIAPGCADSYPHGLVTFDGLTGWFSASSPQFGTELYRLRADGTTEMVRDLRPGTAGSSPYGLISLRGGILFLATDGVHGREPWFVADTQ